MTDVTADLDDFTMTDFNLNLHVNKDPSGGNYDLNGVAATTKIYVDSDISFVNYGTNSPKLVVDQSSTITFDNKIFSSIDISSTNSNNSTISLRNCTLKPNGGPVVDFNGTLDFNDTSCKIIYATKHQIDSSDVTWDHTLATNPVFEFIDNYDFSTGGEWDIGEIIGNNGFDLSGNVTTVDTLKLPVDLSKNITIKCGGSNTTTFNYLNLVASALYACTFDVNGNGLPVAKPTLDLSLILISRCRRYT